MTSASTILSLALLSSGGGRPPSSHALTHQADYNDERGEYCYRESFNLGTCLGRRQEESLDLSDEQLLRCLECSGTFRGDETCKEIKAMNDVANGSDGTEASINWGESFCETYNLCVEQNCPKDCLLEQDGWLECLIIELDCDWRCPGSTWLLGSRTMDLNGTNGAANTRDSTNDTWIRFFFGGEIILTMAAALAGWA